MLGPNSTVEVMQKRLRELRAPWYGTKDKLWARLVDEEAKNTASNEWHDFLSKRRAELEAAVHPAQRVILPAPRDPTQEERDAHDLHHLSPAPWCEVCAMGKGR